jgi:hypothetical protein
MEEINGKKRLLQNEITRLNTEMGNVKLRTINQPQIDKPCVNLMGQKDVQANVGMISLFSGPGSDPICTCVLVEL